MKKTSKFGLIFALFFAVVGLVGCNENYESPFVNDKEVVNTYTVTFWNNERNEIIDTVQVKEHDTAYYRKEESSLNYRSADGKTDYIFNGWVEIDKVNKQNLKNYSLENITHDAWFAPTFEVSAKYYNVKFYDYKCEELLYETEVKEHETAVFDRDPSVLQRANDGYTIWAFKDWVKLDKNMKPTLNHSLDDITEDSVYAAYYVVAEQYYNVKFYNYERTKVLYETKILEHETANYFGDTDISERVSGVLGDDVLTTYKFRNWVKLDQNLNPTNIYGTENITSDTAFAPAYDVKERSYHVKFYDYDCKNVIYDTYVKEGNAASYHGTLDISRREVREDGGYKVFIFKNWVRLNKDLKPTSNYDLNNITEATSFAPTYEISSQYYHVAFYDYNHKLICEYDVEEGGNAVFPSTYESSLEKEGTAYIGYRFVNWVELVKYGDNLYEMGDFSLYNIRKNVNLAPKYEEYDKYYDVYFYSDETNTTILDKHLHVKAGSRVDYEGVTPYKTDDERYVYRFAGWDKAEDLKEVLKNLEVYPVYSTTNKLYSVTWKDYDGKTLDVSVNIKSGTNVTTELKPTKESVSDDKSVTSYKFVGWSLSKESSIADAANKLADLTENLVVYAAFEANVSKSDRLIWEEHIDEKGSLMIFNEAMSSSFKYVDINNNINDSYYVGCDKSLATYSFHLYKKGILGDYQYEFSYYFTFAKDGSTAVMTGINDGDGYISVYSETNGHTADDNVYAYVSLPLFDYDVEKMIYTLGEPLISGYGGSVDALAPGEINEYTNYARICTQVAVAGFSSSIKKYCKDNNLPWLR